MDLSEVRALEAAGLPLRRHPWEMCRARLVAHWLSSTQLKWPRILDVGCGDAYILSALARVRPDLECIGVDTAYAEPVTLDSGVRLFPELSQVPSGSPHPGLVTLMDVLEHVPDDGAMLRELRAAGWLAPGTRVFVTVPAFQKLFGRHDELLGHYRRYNRQRLRSLLETEGLHVERVGYWFFLPLLLRGLEIARERVGLAPEPKSGLVAWRVGARVSGWIAELLYRESQALGALQSLGLPIGGLTCFAICTVSR